ncbi:MAG TPA: R3H domain-containing nucleic acid-binding protein [Anaerolineae bacterium]|nr:R3H domain-containing nucleic acid-binding protein [Anaerolineae bacterium]
MTDSMHLIVDDLDALMRVLPAEIQMALHRIQRWDDFLEVILDLGRIPTARYVNEEVVLLEREISREDIQAVVNNIGEFDADNRAGLERTLHRISGIRNRKGDVVGLTCRVGRAVFGTIDILEDLIASGKSVLLLGRPAVGKTTMLREAARVLSEKKRVVIVDTSNEIAGDGDIPHPAIGRARRMQVAMPSLQHEVMIEAVENHNPEVIVIDEIGRELEAMAARTIAERGVQLIATAHGNSLENLLLNPTLSDLIGGIESVTLSDEEARRRGTQKTVLERRAPPTFDVLVEIQDRQRLLVHKDVAESVDALVRGRPMLTELRFRDESGQVHVQQVSDAPVESPSVSGAETPAWHSEGPTLERRKLKEKRVYPFGIARNRLVRAAESLRVPLRIVDNLGEAQVFVTSKQHYRKRPKVVSDAERRGVSMYVLRANTVAQMEGFLAELFGLSGEQSDALTRAMVETEDAIERVANGSQSSVDLNPQGAAIRRQQHEMARDANLMSRSFGQEPQRNVRIYRGE